MASICSQAKHYSRIVRFRVQSGRIPVVLLRPDIQQLFFSIKLGVEVGLLARTFEADHLLLAAAHVVHEELDRQVLLLFHSLAFVHFEISEHLVAQPEVVGSVLELLVGQGLSPDPVLTDVVIVLQKTLCQAVGVLLLAQEQSLQSQHIDNLRSEARTYVSELLDAACDVNILSDDLLTRDLVAVVLPVSIQERSCHLKAVYVCFPGFISTTDLGTRNDKLLVLKVGIHDAVAEHHLLDVLLLGLLLFSDLLVEFFAQVVVEGGRCIFDLATESESEQVLTFVPSGFDSYVRSHIPSARRSGCSS